MTVKLEDGTCGKCGIVSIGELAEVILHDENGNNITIQGFVEEILEE